MSVLIKGMQMPKCCMDCFACHVLSYEGLYCEPLDTDIEPGFFSRLDNCPLVPVPPHGRLIDADALMNEMDKQENAMYEHGREFSFSFKSGGDVCTAWYNVEMMVEDAPTIIEAEEGE